MKGPLLLGLVVVALLVPKTQGKQHTASLRKLDGCFMYTVIMDSLTQRVHYYCKRTTSAIVLCMAQYCGTNSYFFVLHQQQLALMVMFDWWEEPLRMRGGQSCVSTMPGGQCVMTIGIVLMLQWSAGSWDMQPLDVSVPLQYLQYLQYLYTNLYIYQVSLRTW